MDAAPLAPPRAEDAADPLRDALAQAIDRDYELVRLVGRGGMGAVYLARDRALERLVAIKVLPPGAMTDRDLLARFRREARTVANLQHGGIVPLYAFGESRGLCWFVMGYVRGESLAARLAREGALAPDVARPLLAQLADALDHAHRQGIVHRDIKPDNILIDDSTGRALLTDFGIARADALQAATGLTQAGSVMGTPHYMSPEQASAEPVIDGRSDLYSLGVVAYEMLAGRLPFDGKTMREVMVKHVTAAPPPLAEVAPQVPADLAAAVMRCLEKEPSARFADGAALRSALGGTALDEESLAYELNDLKHGAAYVVLSTMVAAVSVAIALIGDGTLFGLPWQFHASGPLLWLKYVTHVREARQRGFTWAEIGRVWFAPPKWWWLWWPRRWRRSSDVWERLPRTLRRARYVTTALTLLLVGEFPLLAWMNGRVDKKIADHVPGLHGELPVRAIAQTQPLEGIASVFGYLLLMLGAWMAAQWIAGRAGKPHGLKGLDVQRLAFTPTDAPFWRSPRVRPLLDVGDGTSSRRPTTPQEFVTQILAATRSTTPGSPRPVTDDAPAAARRLLEVILSCEKERALLDKTAPAERLAQFESELALLEQDGGDPEATAVLESQRVALVRARERHAVLGARIAEAQTRLESLWSLSQRLAAGGDQAAAVSDELRAVAVRVSTDFPPRSSGVTGRVTAASLVLSAALLLGAAPLRARVGTAVEEARAHWTAGRSADGLRVLQAAGDASADRWTLEGQLELQAMAQRKPIARATPVRRARLAFERAAAADSAAVAPLEALAWMYRLLPWFLGGSDARHEAALAALEARAPYRAAVLRGNLERLDRKTAAATIRLRRLTVDQPDSAAAWFARGDLALAEGRLDEAQESFLRYRALRPDDRAILFHLGLRAARYGVGLDEGEAMLRAYVAEPPRPDQPRLDVAWWRLGQVLERAGKYAEARAAFTEALRLDPKDREFAAALRQVTEQLERAR